MEKIDDLKYLGVERGIDANGRISIPAEYLKTMQVKKIDLLQMQLAEIKGEKVIVLKKVA